MACSVEGQVVGEEKPGEVGKGGMIVRFGFRQQG